MADDILQNTLNATSTGPKLPEVPQGLKVPDSSGNVQTDIAKLKAVQQQPSMLLNFQKVMASTAKQAYNDRQSNELNTLGFDPTKVSGNTFAGIIGNLEQNRGMDVSKIYGTTMGTYGLVQQQITDRLEFAQELEESRKRWETEIKLRKAELKNSKKLGDRDYEMKKAQFDMDKKDWERQYAKSLQKVNTEFGKAQLYPMWSQFSA